MKYDVFKRVMRDKGLINLECDGMHMLLNCNLIFKHDSNNGDVSVYGVIPMDLANLIYESMKNVKVDEKLISNSPGHQLVNPEEIATHNSIDFNKIMFESKLTGVDFNVILKEKRQELLKSDYENCYINFSYIYTPEALEWFIDRVKEYYSIKTMIAVKTLKGKNK